MSITQSTAGAGWGEPTAAEAEYARWGTASDTRRPPEARTWVCRLSDEGEWIETTAHRDYSEAEAACHRQALAAALASAPPAGQGSGDASVERIIQEACKPWEFAVGEPPEWGSPLHQVFVAGMIYSERLLAGFLDVETYEAGDGSEDFDADATKSLQNILTAAGLYDPEEGVKATLASAPSAPTPEAGQGILYQYREIGEGEGWQTCTKEFNDHLQRDPNMDTRTMPTPSAQALADENVRLRAALDRARNILGNMAMEHQTGWRSIFARWPIHHEPLRSDARAVLPIINAALEERA